MARTSRRSRGYSSLLQIQCTPDEVAAFEAAAAVSNISKSEWVRLVLREAAERRLASAGQKPAWLQLKDKADKQI